jgi:MtrB/PioB family decaheme-associated outer membrane protein
MFAHRKKTPVSPAPRFRHALLMVSLLGLPPATAPAQTAVDTSGWDCEYCPYSTGWEGTITAGAGAVSDDSFRFGDYRGLEAEGAFAILGGSLLYRNEAGYYTDLYLQDFGLDSRSLQVEGGHQGQYVYRFAYDNLRHLIDGPVRTPFTGTDNLQLPEDWIPAANTAGMSGLPAALHDAELLRERETLATGFDFIQSADWEYTSDFRRQTRSGVDAIGGSFLNSGALLLMPVDYVTDQVDLGVAFNGDRLQAGAAYYGSYFSNDHSALAWDNPFTALASGADRGQLALVPDNDFHQLSLSAAWQAGQNTQLNAGLAGGEMRQDEAFLAATINPELDPGPLPQPDLNGEIDTLNYHLRLTTSPLRRLDLRLEHRFSERDNQTSRAAWPQVDSDIFLSGLRTNIPYSFERGVTEAAAAYRLPGGIKLAAGAEHDTHERSFQDVARTEQDTQWAQAGADLWGMLDLRLKFASESRDASAHNPFEDVAAQENPALRKFNLGDRERDLSQASVGVSPLSWLTIGFTADIAEDRYQDSQIGLTDAKQDSRALDIAITLAADISLYLFGGRDEIDSHIAGSSDFAQPNWFARQRDVVRTGLIGIEFDELLADLDLGIDYTRARSRGATGLLPEPEFPFPDFITRLHSARLHARYALADHLLLRLDFYKERYSAEDWALDGIAIDTIPTFLTLGQGSPGYNVTVLGAAAEYRF